MQEFICTKRFRSNPMSRHEYNEFRGWSIPENEKEDMSGYLIEYLDGSAPNHPDFEGYISWSPKEQFDSDYRPVNGLSFGLAIEAMKKGMKVARTGWNGKSMFLFLVGGSTFTVNRPPLLGIYPEGTEINYHAHIDMKTADDQVVPWLASQTDMLSDDWTIVE